jgi:polyisoprenoid-binding protein YceI
MMRAVARLDKRLLLASSLLLSTWVAAVCRDGASPASTEIPVRSKTIDTGRSTLTVRVFKAGLFSAFGHEHEINAPIRLGFFNEAQPSVELSVDARRLRVVDQDISDKDRAEIQSTMLGPKVLDSERFPEIRFHSTQIDRPAEGKWVVLGELTIRGQTRPVKVEVEAQAGRYRGTTELRQKDFGITPVRAGGGTVKVKNEIRIIFEIVAK